ncbi:MAG: hypothetical protein ACXVHS_08730 [Methanobacterium sp.]
MVNAILAAILSLIIPGLGQILAGAVQKGVIFIVIAIILYLLYMFVFWPIAIITLIFAIYAAYDAYQLAKSTDTAAV